MPLKILMRKTGLTLMEIIVSVLLVALVFMGLANLFVVGRRYIMHARSRMAGGELGKVFLDPLQMDVRQDEWGDTDYVDPDNRLRLGTRESNAQIGGISYNAAYNVTGFPELPATSQMRRVRVDLQWVEPAQ